MRTLKKVLALSLVFAMAFTLMAGAAFKDQASIDSDLNDDITLMTALGVFQGDENGNFNPEQNVTRAQAAKMIYVLKNNGTDDGAAAFTGTSIYADVTTGHWAEGYINYCTNLGYMNGWKEGNVQKFDPNGNVTGVELAKMLLCMIGYKADIQGYTGNNWSQNVQQDASEAGIFVNFTPSVKAATPRQWTARMLVNAINATYVTYTKGELVYGTNTNGTEMSYASKYLKLNVAEGTLAATKTNKLAQGSELKDSLADTLQTSSNEYSTVNVLKVNGVYVDSDKTRTMTQDYKYEADKALLGQKVKVYYRSGNTGVSDLKVYAIMADNSQKVINTTLDQIKYDDDYNADKPVKKVTVEGLGTKTYTQKPAGEGSYNKVNVYVDGVLKSNTDMDAAKKFVGKSTMAVKLIADSNNYITDMYITGYTVYDVVDSVDAANGVLSFDNYVLTDENDNKLSFKKSNKADNFDKYINLVDSISDDDVVAITVNTDSGKLVYDIKKAATVSGPPSAYTLSSSRFNTVTLGGEKYNFAMNTVGYKMGGTATNEDLDKIYDRQSASGSIATDKTFYTDGKYIVYSDGGSNAVSVNNLAFVIGSQTGTSYGDVQAKVKVLLTDGTTNEYTVSNLYNAGSKTKVENTGKDDDSNPFYAEFRKNAAQGNVYSYSVSDNKIALTKIKTEETSKAVTSTQQFYKTSSDLEYNKSSKTLSDGTLSVKVTEDTYFFVRTGTKSSDYKYAVVKGNELAKTSKSEHANGVGTGNGLFAAKLSGGMPTATFGVLFLESGNYNVSSTQYAFAMSNGSYSSDGDKHYVDIKVNENGEEKTVKIEYADLGSANTAITSTFNAIKGKVISFEANSSNIISDEDTVRILKNATDKIVNNDLKVTEGYWNYLRINGWNSSSAYVAGVTVDENGKGNAVASSSTFVNVASDVKIYYVDKTDNTLVDSNKVVNTSSDTTEAGANDYTAFAFVKDTTDGPTITDIFVEVDGRTLNVQ